MSVEGLYSVEFGTGSGRMVNGSIVVLETGRIFGGDSGFYYLGSFDAKDDQVTAEFTATKFNPSERNAWRDAATSFTVKAKLTRTADQRIVGEIERAGFPMGHAVLTRRASLP